MEAPLKTVPRYKCEECKYKFKNKEDLSCPNKHNRGNQQVSEYGLLVCQNCNKTHDRDKNAARNIGDILKSYLLKLGRPIYLKRKKKDF